MWKNDFKEIRKIDYTCYIGNRIVRKDDVIIVRFPTGKEQMFRAKSVVLENGMQAIILEDK